MEQSIQPLVKITDICQVAWIVRDIDKTMKSWWNTFGIGPWDIWLRDPDSTNPGESITNETYYGKPAKYSYKVASTHNKIGGINFELIQPVAGDSTYRDFLRDHGEGVHHIGWQQTESLEHFYKTIKALETAGFPCITSGRHHNGFVAYIDATKVLNTILEVVWRDPTRSRPAPQYVFPE
jgi:methylmalonyl-CoA/ethylmalonyl-CoA epimerase